MAKPPFVILIELFAGLAKSILDTLGFLGAKLIELFASLIVFSTFGLLGVIMAAVIGVCVFIFVVKFVLASSGTLIKVVAALFIVLGVLILISMLI